MEVLELKALLHNGTQWTADQAKCILNVTLDASIVGTEDGGCRADTAHVVVLDDFLPPSCCRALLEHLTSPNHAGPTPPSAQWERATADGPGQPLSWGLNDASMRALSAKALADPGAIPGLGELHARLCALYPEFDIVHQPSMHPRAHAPRPPSSALSSEPAAAPPATTARDAAAEPPTAEAAAQPPREQPAAQPQAVCEAFVANAATFGDVFKWHVDGDPCALADCLWTDAFGRFHNRDRGKPLLVSALVYLNADWPADLAAETLFADSPTGTGVFVRPACGRCVLMDQDVVHRVNAPSALAEAPRYSFVEKLVFLPRAGAHSGSGAPPAAGGRGGGELSIARPVWGAPTAFGSAARLQRMARAAQEKGREGREDGGPQAKRACLAEQKPGGADGEGVVDRTATGDGGGPVATAAAGTISSRPERSRP